MLGVLETVENVVSHSRQVNINRQAINFFSRELLGEEFEIPPWDSYHHFNDGGENTVSYLMVLDTINYCFWAAAGKEKWEISYKNESLSGYYAMAVSLKTALESGVPIVDMDYLSKISLYEFKKIMGGKGELQLLETRVQHLNELGQVLQSRYGGKAHRVVESAAGSATKLAGLLAQNLPSFRDISEYYGKKVIFLKRAQILSADLNGAFGGKKWGRFTDMDTLTAFADYKLPQVLRQLAILSYDQSLSEKIDQGITLESGGSEEIEIRANTIWAVELIRQELEANGRRVRAFELDWMLWNMGQQMKYREKRYHRTLTYFY